MKNDMNFWIDHYKSLHKASMNVGRQALGQLEKDLESAPETGACNKAWYQEMIDEQKEYIAAHKFMLDAINDLRTKKKISKI